jgi:hypothetical protein
MYVQKESCFIDVRKTIAVYFVHRIKMCKMQV